MTTYDEFLKGLAQERRKAKASVRAFAAAVREGDAEACAGLVRSGA